VQAASFDQHRLQLPEIAVIEKPADHVRRDLIGADGVELVPWHEFNITIGISQRSFETERIGRGDGIEVIVLNRLELRPAVTPDLFDVLVVAINRPSRGEHNGRWHAVYCIVDA
jgi:hypothetical protein